MKIDTIKTAQPTVLVEFTLTEVKILRDTLGEIEYYKIEEKLIKKGINTHPNYREYIYTMHTQLSDMAEQMVKATTPDINKHL